MNLAPFILDGWARVKSNMHRWLGFLLAGVLCPTLIYAGGVMTLKGSVFSVMRDEFVIQSGHELFYVKKDALTADQREKFEKARSHEITVDVPMNAITRVRSSKAEMKSPADGH